MFQLPINVYVYLWIADRVMLRLVRYLHVLKTLKQRICKELEY